LYIFVGRKQVELEWNPVVSDILGSSSADGALKFWDVRKAVAAYSYERIFGDTIQSFKWNEEGALLFTKL
jgi:hypothetical protein